MGLGTGNRRANKIDKTPCPLEQTEKHLNRSSLPKGEKRLGDKQGERLRLNRMGREGLSEQVMLQRRPEGGSEQGWWVSRGEASPANGSSQCKALAGVHADQRVWSGDSRG